MITVIKTAVSLFSNCGAGDVGYHKAGFSFSVMAELERKRLEVCLLNHTDAIGIEGDLINTWPKVVAAYRKAYGRRRPAMLAACPPCQGMSSARGARGSHEDPDVGSKDGRNLLAVVIAKVAQKLNPRLIVVENVPQFLTRAVRHPDTNIPMPASRLLTDILSASYEVFPIQLNMTEFGVPQTRKRCFLTFIHKSEKGLKRLRRLGKIPYPKTVTSQNLNVGEFLKKLQLEKLDAAHPSTAGVGMHSVPVWSEDRYKMVAAIPPGTGRSAWQNNECLQCGEKQSRLSAIRCRMCGSVLPKPIKNTKNGKVRLIHGFQTSYKRMAADAPAATILTASHSIGSHNTIHPYQNRVLSILECAKLQTLDDDFVWGDALTKHGPTNVRAMIGEAVPPAFTKLHGEILMKLLSGKVDDSFLDCNYRGYKLANKKLMK